MHWGSLAWLSVPSSEMIAFRYQVNVTLNGIQKSQPSAMTTESCGKNVDRHIVSSQLMKNGSYCIYEEMKKNQTILHGKILFLYH